MIFDFLSRNLPVFLSATLLTVQLAFLALVCGGLLGFGLALARLMVGRELDRLIAAPVDFLRGTPPLVQLLTWYLGSAALGVPLTPFVTTVVGLSMITAAFTSEIFRGAISAVPKGQREAALSIGLTKGYSIIAIELPQAWPAIIPALIGSFISLIKDTSLAYVVGIHELTRATRVIADREFRPLVAYGFCALVYFALCFPLSKVVGIADRRLQATGIAQKKLSV